MQEMRRNKRIGYHGQVLINNLVKAPCVSLSESGMFVGTGYHLPLNSTATLEFLLNRDLIRTNAEVRHAQKDIGIGLSFLDLNFSAREMVQKYVELRSGAETEVLNRRILHVDPDPFKRRLYKGKLVADGYTVFEASDGTEALSMLQRRTMDLLIMDLYLKDMEGLNLISQIRQNPEWKNMPIVVLASKSILYDIKRARDYGASDFMLKMTTSPVLLSGAIKKLLPRTVAPGA